MTTKIFLQAMPEASKWRKGTGVKALLFSDLYFPSGHLVTSIDRKDKVFVLVFCHSRVTRALQVLLEVLLTHIVDVHELLKEKQY